MLAFLRARAIEGLEIVNGDCYTRSISLDGLHGWFSVAPGGTDALALTLHFPEPRAQAQIVARIRRLLDLDTDLAPIHQQLSADPLMARLIASRPGLRVPGAWDGFELAVRAVLGQQITVGAAIRLAGKLVAQYGQPLCCAAMPVGLSHVFPEPARMAGADLASLGMPRSRGRTLSGVAQALLDDPQLFAPRPALNRAWRPCWRCGALATGPRITWPCASFARRMLFPRRTWACSVPWRRSKAGRSAPASYWPAPRPGAHGVATRRSICGRRCNSLIPFSVAAAEPARLRSRTQSSPTLRTRCE